MPSPKSKSPAQLFLLSDSKNKFQRRNVKAGLKKKWFGYAANQIAYYLLTPKNGDYLQMARLWPITLQPTTVLKEDSLWGRWFFNVAEIGKPIELSNPAAWELLVANKLANKPRKKTDDCALNWPALKGYTGPLRVLLDNGVTAGKDDPLTAAAAFGQPATAKLLADEGFDVKKSIAVMEKYKNERAVTILRALL